MTRTPPEDFRLKWKGSRDLRFKWMSLHENFKALIVAYQTAHDAVERAKEERARDITSITQHNDRLLAQHAQDALRRRIEAARPKLFLETVSEPATRGGKRLVVVAGDELRLVAHIVWADNAIHVLIDVDEPQTLTTNDIEALPLKPAKLEDISRALTLTMLDARRLQLHIEEMADKLDLYSYDQAKWEGIGRPPRGGRAALPGVVREDPTAARRAALRVLIADTSMDKVAIAAALKVSTKTALYDLRAIGASEVMVGRKKVWMWASPEAPARDLGTEK